jgi:transposase
MIDVPYHVLKELYRSKSLGSRLIKKYDKEGTEGLKDRTISGRPSELS